MGVALSDLLALGAIATLNGASGRSCASPNTLGRAAGMNAGPQVHGFEHQRLWIDRHS